MVTTAGGQEFALLERLSRMSQGATAGVSVRSALNPLLKLCAIATPSCLTAAYFFRANAIVMGALVVTAMLPIYAVCAAYWYFAGRQPERLQSEEFQLRHEAVQLIHTRSFDSSLDQTVLAQIATAPLHHLEAGPGKEQ
jgi:hypothetical protein